MIVIEDVGNGEVRAGLEFDPVLKAYDAEQPDKEFFSIADLRKLGLVTAAQAMALEVVQDYFGPGALKQAAWTHADGTTSRHEG